MLDICITFKETACFPIGYTSLRSHQQYESFGCPTSLSALGMVSLLAILIGMWAFPGDSVVKNLPANAGDAGLILELGSSPGEGNGNPLQYSCPGNPMDREAWRATVHGVAKVLDMT